MIDLAKQRKALITEEVHQEMLASVPKQKVITPHLVAKKFNVTLSIARAVMKTLAERGTIVPVLLSAKLSIYTMAERRTDA